MAHIISGSETAVLGQPITLHLSDVEGAARRLALWTVRGGLGEFHTTGPRSEAAIQDIDGTEYFVAQANWKLAWLTPGEPARAADFHVEIYAPKEGAPIAPTEATGDDFLERYDPVDSADLSMPITGPQAVARVIDGDGPRAIQGRSEPVAVSVTMRPADVQPSASLGLWNLIRSSTSALSFDRYSRFMDVVLCGADPAILDPDVRFDDIKEERDRVKHRMRLPFPDTDAYRQLKVATEVFMMMNCGVQLGPRSETPDDRLLRKWGIGSDAIVEFWKEMLAEGAKEAPDAQPTILYLALVRNKLRGVDVLSSNQLRTESIASILQPEEAAVACQAILLSKLTNPCFLELIWNYWHEEGLLVQTMNAISWRFQNRRGMGDRDPLALLEIDPLRPLNNFIWGWLQDEQHRLTLVRRAYEYDHHYGITLLGKAVPPVRGADSRTRFIEAFHNLLYLCSIFFKEEDDTTVIADGFTVLNALKEVHLLLTQGAHNQYGDLPWTARQEMLIEQWLLARPEFREFLPRRIMVDYPEEWMDSVETMKTLQAWKTASVMHFRDLGVFGEQILLGVRFGAWPSIIEPVDAANWARYWRPEIQGYIHAYRAATGVDLTEQANATMPAILLQQRMAAQLPPSVRGRLPMQVGGNGRAALPARRVR